MEEIKSISEAKPRYVMTMYSRLAIVVSHHGDRIDKAIKLMKRAVELQAMCDENDHASGSIYSNLGLLLRWQGDFQDAINAMWQAYYLNPSQTEILHDIGLMHLQMHTPEKAEDLFDKFLQGFGDLDNLKKHQSLRVASVLHALGKIRGDHLLQQNRDAFFTGRCLPDSEFRIEAEAILATFRKAIEVCPENTFFEDQLGVFAFSFEMV